MASLLPGQNMSQRVHFNDNTVVHHMIVWDYAYRSARVSPWETVARDRARFTRRITQLEGVIGPVLSPHHRETVQKIIYKKMGSNDSGSFVLRTTWSSMRPPI